MSGLLLKHQYTGGLPDAPDGYSRLTVNEIGQLVLADPDRVEQAFGAAYATPISGAYTLSRANLDQAIDATAAAAITIPPDSTLGIESKPLYRACVAVYQAGAGAVSWVAGAGVTLRGTAPLSAQYKVQSVMRVGPNEWAYL